MIDASLLISRGASWLTIFVCRFCPRRTTELRKIAVWRAHLERRGGAG